MKSLRIILSLLIMAALATGILIFMKNMTTENGPVLSSEGFIGKSEIAVTDGHMTPEVLLALGRLSDPQVSPDGQYILYGVSYTSVEDNRSVRNLYICKLDGTDNQLITQSGKSVANARWSADGKHIAFMVGGQICVADIELKDGVWTLGDAVQVSDIPAERLDALLGELAAAAARHSCSGYQVEFTGVCGKCRFNQNKEEKSEL